MPEIAKFRAKLLKKNQLTVDIIELKFAKPSGFNYLAGQFLQWIIIKDGKEILRPYSLSSAPGDETVDFCVKILPDGTASKVAEQIEMGDELALQGPRGAFVNQSGNSSLYCIATGAGLAPIMSIIRDELEYKKTNAEVRLLFGVRAEADIFWRDRLESLKSRQENFSFQITLSQPKAGGGWSGLRGRVTDHVLHHLVAHNFFLCGNAAMVKDVRQVLLENGVDGGKIHFEIF